MKTIASVMKTIAIVAISIAGIGMICIGFAEWFGFLPPNPQPGWVTTVVMGTIALNLAEKIGGWG